MSSSGLIYAVIVGAWAAYLVPMWLRRQDELNEARPTERFSTAIRLLSGKAAMERRYAKEAGRRAAEASEAEGDRGAPGDATAADGDAGDGADESAPDAADDAVDVRVFADPASMAGTVNAEAVTDIAHPSAGTEHPVRTEGERPQKARGARAPSTKQHAKQGANRSTSRNAKQNTKRAKVLARRRRTTMMLFLAFTFGSVVAAVGGLAFLWAPGIPALLLSAYIVHLRAKERRRFAVTMDRRRAEAAAQRLRERPASAASASAAAAAPEPCPGEGVPERDQAARSATSARATAEEEPGAADRRALVEQTDHAEWVDQERGRDREQSEGEGWEPVPVPLPTYVSAPVAPRSARGVDLEAPDTWSSARSSTAEASQSPTPPAEQAEPAPRARRPRERSRTPLFDQYEDETRPRAANE